MTGASPAELQRLVATAFDARGWEYDPSIGPAFVEAIRKRGTADAAQLVRLLPAAFFERNRVTRPLVEKAIEGAIGGRTLKEASVVRATIVIGGSNYQLNVGPGASILNSNINLGAGVQVNVSDNGSKEDVLLGVEALVRAGLVGYWDDEAGRALGEVIDGRSDLSYEDVQQVTTEVVKAEQPAKERIKDFIGRIAVSGLSGALSSGVTTGLGEALAHIHI